jgi:hypothetical protein
MGLHADILFTYDGRGRMLETNEPGAAHRRPAPLAFLGRTGVGWILRTGRQVADGLVRELGALKADQRDPLAAVRQSVISHVPGAVEGSGPAYRFPDRIEPYDEAVRITADNNELALDTFRWLHDEIEYWQPCFGVVREAAAVSVCFSSRIGARALDAGVVTLAEFRGRGYASAVTAAWAASVRASGRVPLYSTSWSNSASLGVARRLGLVKFGEDTTWGPARPEGTG